MTRTDHIPLIDYLRGLAAAMVTWFHLTNGYPDNWVARSGTYGWLGVEIFFVISGFVITLALARPGHEQPGARRLSTFMLKRIIRLEPPYIASIVLVLILGQLSALSPAFRGTAPDIKVPQLLAHLGYLIPFTRYDWLQPVYWTLTYEFFFYIFAGMFLPLLSMRHGTPMFVLASAVVAAMVMLSQAPPLILLFVFGIAACRLHLGQDRRWLSSIVVLSSAAAMTFVGMGLQSAVGLCTVVLIVGHSHVPTPPPHLARLLAALGAISYSLYLIHVPFGGRIINLGGRYVAGSLQQFALSVVAFLLSCAAATMFWWLIERPAHRAAQRFGRRSRPSRSSGDTGDER